MTDWITPDNPAFHFGGIQNLMRFKQVHNARKKEYPFVPIKSQDLTDLKTNGYGIVKKSFFRK